MNKQACTQTTIYSRRTGRAPVLLIFTCSIPGDKTLLCSAIAVTIIGGQTLCLLLTLIVTPVTYSLLSELGQLKLAGALKAFLNRGAAEERSHG